MTILRLLCFCFLAVGYFAGLFESGLIISKAANINVRKRGSGNLGATNVMRVMGVPAGLLTYFLDILKVFIPTLIFYFVFVKALGFNIDSTAILFYTGFGVVLGHDFPFYLKFKGGKGMSCTTAIYIGLLDWRLIIIGLLVFFGIAFLTKYVSVASMIFSAAMSVLFIIFVSNGYYFVYFNWRKDCYIISILLCLLLIFRHKSNIIKLLDGTEKKFSLPKKPMSNLRKSKYKK